MPADMRNPGRQHRRWSATVLKLALSAVLIAILSATANWRSVAETLYKASPGDALAALGCLALTPLFSGLRWSQAMRALRFSLPLPSVVRATYSSLFLGQFLPAGVGVDAARFGTLWQMQIPPSPAIASIGLDRVAGLIAISALMAIGLPFVPQIVPARVVASIFLALIAGAFVGLALIQVDRISWIKRRLDAATPAAGTFVASVRSSLLTRHFGCCLLHAAAIQLLCLMAVSFIAHALGYAPSFWQLMTITSAALFASLLPISFNGWGVREGALVLGLSALQIPRESALLISLCYGAMLLAASLPGAFMIRLHAPASEAA
jgi:glycosyltransferase 2 family protein